MQTRSLKALLAGLAVATGPSEASSLNASRIASKGDAKLDFCFVSLNAFGSLTNSVNGFAQVGGVQRQTALVCRWLASRGHKVSVVTWGHREPEVFYQDGIQIIQICPMDEGMPIARWLHPRATSLWNALGRAKARIYYHNEAEAVTGLIALWCRVHGHPFVFSAAAEADCHASLPRMRKPWERMLFRYGLRSAKVRIVQSRTQQNLLAEGSGLSSVHLPMPSDGPEVLLPSKEPAGKKPNVLWVGRVDRNKRLEWLLSLAEKLPDVGFTVVSVGNNTAYAAALRQKAESAPNVSWHETVPFSEMGRMYRNATCLCSTSEREGFPNTFLEAWSHAIPVVSTFDPDQIIVREKLGFAATNLSGLESCLKTITASEQTRNECGLRARRYFENHHAVSKVMPRFEKMLLELS